MDRSFARARLEEALSSADLCSKDSVRRLVNKAFLHSPRGGDLGLDSGVLNSRFEEVWKFLSELRGVGSELAKESAVVDDIDGRGWKVRMQEPHPPSGYIMLCLSENDPECFNLSTSGEACT